MTERLYLVRETEHARLYRKRSGSEMWFPRSVCLKTLKFPPMPGMLPIHEVEVADWFMEKNPWPPEQRKLL